MNKVSGWYLGLLVARNVTLEEDETGKVAPSKFAELAGIYKCLPFQHIDNLFSQGKSDVNKSILKRLMVWNKASMDGLVPHSSLINPGQDIEFDERHTEEVWNGYLEDFDEWYCQEFNDFILDERFTQELWNKFYNGQNTPCVYFIGYKDRPDLPVKIGKANDVNKRLSELQTGSGMKLEVLFTVPGYSDEETKFHKLFEDKRTQGEWFNLTSEDLDRVRSNINEK